MGKGTRSFFFFAVFVLLFGVNSAMSADVEFEKFCREKYIETGTCPDGLCVYACLPGQKSPDCPKTCRPQECTAIPTDQCPKEYCNVMTDCSDQKICHFKMVGEKAKCGDLAYAGQDVACCKGLVRRCGVEFFDHTCDMEGKNSMYSLPICIPCGDGVCENFENHCNCPEDCQAPGEESAEPQKK